MLSAEEIRRVTAPLGSASTLPPRAYTSPEVFDAERRTIFHRAWICVARAEELPAPGDYLTVAVVDQPLIVVRLANGALHAMSAICAHRAMPVAEGRGRAEHFRCPYHLWRYDLDGRLVSAPYMDGVDLPADCGLTPVRIETWAGFVFVNLDAGAEPLGARLGGLDAIVAGYRMADMRLAASRTWDCPWNWKILIENFMEAYHHIGPHAASVQPTHPAGDSYVSGSVDDGWSVLHMPQTGAVDADELPPIEGLSERQRRETLASLIMPSFCWLNTPSVCFWYQLQPAAHDRMNLVIHTLLPEAVADGPNGAEIAAGVQRVIDDIHVEDIAANAGPWRGLNAPLTGQGPLSRLEASIWQLNQWWVRRLGLA